jgi:hypothetical protein
MKYIAAISVWNKVDMIAWLLHGLTTNFSPKDTEIVIHFDACADDSIKAFEAMTDFWLKGKGFKWKALIADQTAPQLREIGGHNALLRYFMETDAEYLFIAQDDQHINRPVWPHLEALAAQVRQEGRRLGMITGRDGYDWPYLRFAGSCWSESALHERLQHGDWRERPCMNTGPLIYPKEVVKSIGFQDSAFTAYYAWDDYALRAIAAGFTNFVLGMDLIHAKFGRVTPTWWAVTGDNAAHDLALLKGKHGLL